MKLRDLLLSRILTASLLLCMLIATPGCTAAAKKARALNRAGNYFKAGDYEKAKIEYLNTLRLDPQNAVAIQRLGTILFEEGATLRAFPYLLGSRQVAPDNVEARTKLGLAFLTLGQAVEARKEASFVLKKDPHFGEAALLLADTSATREELAESELVLNGLPDQNSAFVLQARASLAFRRGDVDGARGFLLRAQTADPKQPTVHLALGTLAVFKKEMAEAEKQFKTAADLSPPRGFAKIKYADFKMSTGAVGEAKALLADIARQTPDFLPAWQMQAQIANLEKDYKQSSALLDHILAQDSNSLEANLLLAENLLAQNDSKKAIEGLARVDGIYKTVPAIKFALARAYLQDNNRNAAVTALTQTLAIAPDYLEADLLLANVNLKNGDNQAVVTSMTELLRKQANIPAAQLMLAEAQRGLGHFDEAVQALEAAIKRDPKDAQPYLLLGAIRRQQDNDGEARRSFEKALEISPDDLTILSQVIELDLKENKPEAAVQRAQARLQKTPDAAPALLLMGRTYASVKDWEHAEAVLRKAVESAPDELQSYSLLITCYTADNKLPQALDLLNGRLAKAPGDSRTLLMLALLYERQQNAQKARDVYEKLLTISPDSASILNNLAYLYSEKLNQPDRALDMARRAHNLDANNPSYSDTLGWILYKQGDYTQALSLLQTSAAKQPGEPEIQYHLAMANYMMGQTEAARDGFQKAVASPRTFPGKEGIAARLALLGGGTAPEKPLSTEDLERLAKEPPGDPLVWNRLGDAYEKQGVWEKARLAYEQARKLNPKLAPPLIGLARIYSDRLHDANKAGEAAKAARDAAPNNPQAAAVLGHVLYLAGNYARAGGLLQEAAHGLPGDAGVLHDLAWTTYYSGDVTEAGQIMQNAVKADVTGSQTHDAKDFLAMIALEQGPSASLAAAESEIGRVLKNDPASIPARMAQAALQTQRGDAKAATASYQEMLRRVPNFAPAQKGLATLYLDDPRTSAEAFEMAAKARQMLPNDAALAETFAVANYQRQAFPYALQLLQESARRKPLGAKSSFYLGMCYLQTKQKDLGVQTLRSALDAGLQTPLADAAREAIEDAGKK